MGQISGDNWYVITGGPSTGKTTILKELSRLGYATVGEAARAVIDDAVAAGVAVEDLREDEKAFQDKVVKRRDEMEAAASPDIVTFFDRGRQDSLAYYRYYQYPIEKWVKPYIAKGMYRKVFVLEPLGIDKHDYARTENLDFNDYITDLLMDAYREYGLEPVLVPPISVEERMRIILKDIDDAQTDVITSPKKG